MELDDDRPGDNRAWWKMQLDFLLWHREDLSNGSQHELRKIRAIFQRTGRITGEQQRYLLGCRRVLGMGISFDDTVKGVKRALIDRALEFTGGNKQQAASLLKLKRTTLQCQIKQLEKQPAEETFPGSVVIEEPDNILAEEALKKAAHTELLIKRIVETQNHSQELTEALKANVVGLRELYDAMRGRFDKKQRKAPTVIGIANTDKVSRG